ncbi:unnamed protein product [Amoebophrya sp. A25]|nr:unnamed protein product [Amoebophrya sp. A25]|eukprot:GSA25T00018445001.1
MYSALTWSHSYHHPDGMEEVGANRPGGARIEGACLRFEQSGIRVEVDRVGFRLGFRLVTKTELEAEDRIRKDPQRIGQLLGMGPLRGCFGAGAFAHHGPPPPMPKQVLKKNEEVLDEIWPYSAAPNRINGGNYKESGKRISASGATHPVGGTPGGLPVGQITGITPSARRVVLGDSWFATPLAGGCKRMKQIGTSSLGAGTPARGQASGTIGEDLHGRGKVREPGSGEQDRATVGSAAEVPDQQRQGKLPSTQRRRPLRSRFGDAVAGELRRQEEQHHLPPIAEVGEEAEDNEQE